MKIVYTGGGTLGSVTPLLAFAREDEADERLWIGTVDGPEKKYVEDQGIPFVGIRAFRLRRFFSLKTVFEFPSLFTSYFKSRKILKQFQPNIVLTAGSFIGVPVCLASRSLRIPYVVIQLDVRPGLANRILFSGASSIIVPHEDYRKKIPYSTVSVCGIPVSVKKQQFVSNKKHIIAVVGGGTGASWLNQFVKKHIDTLLNLGELIHIQGKKERSVILERHVNYFSYFQAPREQVLEAFKKADLIITRAGMGTLLELAALGKPAIVVPMPNSHQEDNADFFVKYKSVLTANQNDGFDNLLSIIQKALSQPEERQLLAFNISHVFPDNSASQLKKMLSHVNAQK